MGDNLSLLCSHRNLSILQALSQPSIPLWARLFWNKMWGDLKKIGTKCLWCERQSYTDNNYVQVKFKLLPLKVVPHPIIGCTLFFTDLQSPVKTLLFTLLYIDWKMFIQTHETTALQLHTHVEKYVYILQTFHKLHLAICLQYSCISLLFPLLNSKLHIICSAREG